MQRNDILKLLFETPYETLRERADEVRAREKGEHVFVRGLIEFSNRCERNCRYCGLRSANPSLKRYRLDEAQIVEAAERAVAFGVDTLVLQSGEVHDEPQRIAHVVDALRTRFPVAVTLSVGEQPTASYALWKEAGASRFLLKHETADASLYAALHPGYTLAQRVDALQRLRRAGYEICGSWPYCASLCRGPISPRQRLWRRLIPFQGNGRACSPAAMCSCPVSRRRPTGKTTVFMTTNIESVWMRPVRSSNRRGAPILYTGRGDMLDAPKGLRLHIGLLGRRNVGKSSLLNALAAQSVSIVSDTPGTTTDPVEKTLEFAPLGPVVFLDTAGLDDEGELGRQRTERTLAVLPRTDMALVVTAENVWGHYEETIVSRLREQAIPFLVVMNKTESSVASKDRLPDAMRGLPMVRASAKTGEGLETIRRELVRLSPGESLHEAQLVADLLPEKGVVILVVPIDSGAPKGRLILPQVQTIRDALDGHKLCLVVTEGELGAAFACLKEPPALVVCDSQVVRRVALETPQSVPLTTFSILMARLKGDLPLLAAGAAAIGNLKPGDSVLMMEACSHHPQQDDIGRIKIPRLLQQYAGGELRFDMCAGKSLTDCPGSYDLIVHCGGCTLTRRQMLGRLRSAQSRGIPMTNYGVAISFTQGVLKRVLTPFPDALAACELAHETCHDAQSKTNKESGWRGYIFIGPR